MKSREDTVGISAKISPNNWRLRRQREVWKWTGKDGRILWELNEREEKGHRGNAATESSPCSTRFFSLRFKGS